MMQTGRSLGWVLIAAWALLALLVNSLRFELAEAFFILAPLFPFALWAGFAGISAFLAVRGVRHGAARSAALSLGALLVLGVVFGLYGARIGTLTKFYTLRPRYEAVVTAIKAGQRPATRVHYQVDERPPLRVAFPWPGGILDNWCGVVYDPTGLVKKARLFKPDLTNLGDPSLSDVRSLFGGDLCFCEPLGGDWYFCCFT
jgi:hypothetical protein